MIKEWEVHSDQGTLALYPTLVMDGSFAYTMALRRRVKGGTIEKHESYVWNQKSLWMEEEQCVARTAFVLPLLVIMERHSDKVVRVYRRIKVGSNSKLPNTNSINHLVRIKAYMDNLGNSRIRPSTRIGRANSNPSRTSHHLHH